LQERNTSSKNKRIKKCYVTKEERVSQASILVPSTRNILILRARRHVHEKDTQGNFLHGSRCQIAEEKRVTRLVYKECFKGLVEINMEPTLGQRRRDENVIRQDTMRPLQCNFYEPKEGKLGIFFTFREFEKT
jgi:hypothetical protein